MSMHEPEHPNRKLYALYSYLKNYKDTQTFYYQDEIANHNLFINDGEKRSDVEWVKYWHDEVIVHIYRGDPELVSNKWWNTVRVMQNANWLVKRMNIDVDLIKNYQWK